MDISRSLYQYLPKKFFKLWKTVKILLSGITGISNLFLPKKRKNNVIQKEEK